MDDKAAAARIVMDTRIPDYDKLPTTGNYETGGSYDNEDWTDAGPSWYDKAKAWVVIKVYSASQFLAHL